MPQDDPRFTESTIPTFIIAGLVEHAVTKGLNPESWFAGLGLTVAHIQQSEAMISFRQATTIICRAVRELPSEPLGLHVGSREALISFGMLGFAMLSSQNVREAVATGLEYHLASGSLMDFKTESSPTEIALQLHERFPDPELLPFLCEEVFASSIAIIRVMLGNEVTPLGVELSYSPPPYAAAYQRLFNCPIRFNSHTNRIVFSASLMDRPLATRSTASHAIALATCRRLIEPAATNQDIISSVENLLREKLRQRPSMTDIASWLNITERTLRRHLTEAGQRFSDIRDRVMEQRARILLSNSTMPIANIAEELGFSDARDFRRAFRRWTGLTPMGLRQEMRKP